MRIWKGKESDKRYDRVETKQRKPQETSKSLLFRETSGSNFLLFYIRGNIGEATITVILYQLLSET